MSEQKATKENVRAAVFAVFELSVGKPKQERHNTLTYRNVKDRVPGGSKPTILRFMKDPIREIVESLEAETIGPPASAFAHGDEFIKKIGELCFQAFRENDERKGPAWSRIVDLLQDTIADNAGDIGRLEAELADVRRELTAAAATADTLRTERDKATARAQRAGEDLRVEKVRADQAAQSLQAVLDRLPFPAMARTGEAAPAQSQIDDAAPDEAAPAQTARPASADAPATKKPAAKPGPKPGAKPGPKPGVRRGAAKE